MSEIPERKVLKDILLKLKTKTITSEERHGKLAITTRNAFRGYSNAIRKIVEDKSKTINKRGLLGAFGMIEEQVQALISDADALREDMKLYIEALEKYCAELDKTLWDAIEQTRKEAEEQIKQQEKLMKKEPTYRA